jgi:hypothetical protein
MMQPSEEFSELCKLIAWLTGLPEDRLFPEATLRQLGFNAIGTGNLVIHINGYFAEIGSPIVPPLVDGDIATGTSLNELSLLIAERLSRTAR